MATNHQMRATTSAAPGRRGVSLLEVLISMFVLLFGLMGVAAIFPVGNHYAGKSDQLDRGSGLASAALAELKTRGLLRPNLWLDTTGKAIVNPANGNFELLTSAQGPGHAFVLDPIGAADSVDSFAEYFPYDAEFTSATPNENPWNIGALPLTGTRWPIRRVTLPQNMSAPPNSTPKLNSRIAEAVFRLHDDLTNTLPAENDRPGMQRWQTLDVDSLNGNANDTPDDPTDDTALARGYAGSYSWFATVLPVTAEGRDGMQPSNPRYGSFQYEVSVVVMHKREGVPTRDTERMLLAELNLGGDLLVYSDANDADVDYDLVDAAAQDIHAGNWVAVAGVHPRTGKFLLKWYRLLAFDGETDDSGLPSPPFQARNATRHAMLEGAEWPMPSTPAGPAPPALNLRAILIPGVIGVATQTLELETD